MPNWYIHLEVARKIAKLLPQLTPGENSAFNGPGPLPNDLARIIEDYPNYYALGALGPDMFYLLPDFKGHRGNMIAEAASKIIEIYNLIDKIIIDPWEGKFAPISEDSNELVSRLTGGLSDELGRLCQYASGILTEQVFDLLSVAFPDWFGILGCGPGAAFDDSLFFWSDMFHYRRTNEFACDLFQHAMQFTYDAKGNTGPAGPGNPGYEPGVAFALGWMTHIGTDVTGHAFTNEKVGGPFRLHWQRHHVVENHMDAYVYKQNHQGDALYDMVTTSALHFWVQFREDAMHSPKYNYLLGVDNKPPDPDPNAPTAPLPLYPTGLNSRDYYNRRQIFNVDSKIPPELVAFLRDVMKATFYDRNTPDSNDSMPTHPMILAPVTGDARPDLNLMNANFQLFYEYIKLTTTNYYFMPKPVPPDVIPENLDPPIPPGNDDPPSADDPALNFFDLVLGVAALVAYISDWLLYVITVLPGLIADLATYPARVVLYQFEMGFYLLWRSFRYLLVLEGFDLPQPDEIDNGLITLGVSSKGVSDNLLTNIIGDVSGGLFGYGPPQPSPDEIVPDPVYPRDTVVDEQNLLEQIVAGVRGLLDKVSSVGLEALGPNDAPQPSEYLSPWRYPSRNYAGRDVLGEPGHTTAGPYQPGSPFALPEFLVETNCPGTDQARQSYEAASSPAATDAVTDAITDGPGRDMQHIAYLANIFEGLGHVHVLEMSPGQQDWSFVDVTEAAGAPAATFRWGALTSWMSSNGSLRRIAYIDGNGHVQELSISPGQGWSVVDVTQAAGAPAAGQVGALVSWTSTSDNAHIAYIDGNGHVQELSISPGQGWSAVDVTQAAGAPAAQGLAFTLTSWISASDDAQHIAYVDGQGHVQELSMGSGQGWSAVDVTQAAGAPDADLDSPLTSWVSASDDAQHIAYLEGENHVQELSMSPGQGWSVVDVTQAAGAPDSQWSALTSWISASDDAQHIAYVDGQGHVQELSMGSGQGWSVVDVTAAAGAPDVIQAGAFTSWMSASDNLEWNNLGDPIHYSLYIIGELTRDTITDPGTVASFNLDSDRGYGYKCWDYDRIQGYDSKPDSKPPPQYAYYANSVDLNAVRAPTQYAVPCTPPRGFIKYALSPDCYNPEHVDRNSAEWNHTLDPTVDPAIIPILNVHDYHPRTNLQTHYLTRLLSDLAASPGDGQVTLTWKPMSGAVSYNLYRSTTDGDGTAGTKIPNVTSGYVDTGLTAGAYYYYVVTAVDSSGAESPPSAQAAAVPGTPPATAPTGMAATAGAHYGYHALTNQPGDQSRVIGVILKVTLTWDNTPGAATYRVYRSTDPAKDWTRLAEPAASPYEDLDVNLTTTYYYHITAVSQSGESGASLVAGATHGGLHYPGCDQMNG
jgi:hypothetical protein